MDVFDVTSKSDFNHLCLNIFEKQYQTIQVYKNFVDALRIKPEDIDHFSKIPFLPISFFKTHEIIKNKSSADVIFSSSGTTGTQTSRHFVEDVKFYEKSYLKGFNLYYGNITNYCVLALLPNYLEREGSSLIYMVEDLIKKSNHVESGFFLYEHQELFQKLNQLKKNKQKTILIGVTYALLDFIESYPINFPELVVMETGGMKGKRKEMIREELHQTLCEGFGISKIHSEYGMTELLSQAYSKGDGIFETPPWMKVLIRDTNDPLTLLETEKTGGINVIDLANENSCSFIATQDLGKLNDDGTFEVLGRFDDSDIRGCNLMVG
ncbi:acyl transferase [Pedobacter psychrophilus]|uniref:Acyl transferase n=1 Tax=Pedobacter psychrophilus TaxID=1826909 RepID=A0A179DMA1_9SPHI|nr:acyl transferase [Pedobacter psychrophilus]OAQ42191.1 acyl transferase [Pedobacter psychrophilus]